MACPSSLALFQYTQGILEGPAQQQVASHVASCPMCQALVQEAFGQVNPPTPASMSLADLLEPHDGEHAPTQNLPLSRAEAPTRVNRARPRPGDDEPATVVRSPGPLGRLEAAPAPMAAPASLPRGTAVGRYLVVEPLGSGGLGQVYTAYDPELDRCVAVKVLRPDVAESDGAEGDSGTGSGRDRLMREAKALARLAHPNVVAVHDVGRHGDDVFIAMERVEGVTLSRWTQDQRRPWKEIRDVFLGAGMGLAAAHEAGIVHRDFKPQNVIVSPDGRPRVLDFGLARAMRQDDRNGQVSLPRAAGFEPTSSHDALEEAITMAGTVMGTPQYMAPEQFEGSDSTGPAADQFGFCVALWMALYDQRPFEGAELPTLIESVRAGRISEPSDRRGVPGWLHRVLLRGLARLADDRYPSMNDLLAALQRDKRSRRRQWAALGIVAMVSGLGAGGVAFALQPPLTDEHRDGVEIMANEARAAAARSYYVYPAPDDEAGLTAYRKVLELEALDGPAEDLADAQASELRQEFSSTLLRLGDRYFERDGGKAFAADYYAAALIFDPDNEHARGRTTLTPGELGQLRAQAAEGEFSAAELAAAASLAMLAAEDEQERRERLLALYAGDQAPSLSTSTRLEALLGDEEVEAVTRATAPRRPRRRPGASHDAQDAEQVFLPVGVTEPTPSEGDTEGGTGGDTEGESDSGGERAEGRELPVPSRRDPAKANTLARQGVAAFKRGKFAESEALFHRALGHNRRNAMALGGLAELYFERGSYQKAVQYAAKAVNAAPRRAKYRIVLGDAYFKTLAYQSARREYVKAQELGHPSAGARLAQLNKRLGK